MQKKMLLVTVIFSLSANVSGQAIISTIAGTGVRGYSGDNAPAISAELDRPEGIVLNSQGDIYITDAYNNVIRRISATDNKITTIAGNGTRGHTGDGGAATSAELYFPQEIAFDSTSPEQVNLYIADGQNNVVRKVNLPTGIITTVAGNGYNAPFHGGYSGDGGPAINAEMDYPGTIAIDNTHNLIIGDGFNCIIRKVDISTGIISTIAGTPRVRSNGGDGGPAINAQIGLIGGICVDSKGNIYVSDFEHRVIRKIDIATGIIDRYAGMTDKIGYSGDGGIATTARISNAGLIAVDSHDNLYLPDNSNNVIRRIDAVTGIITTIAGNMAYGYSGDGGPAINASMSHPSAVTFDKYGTLYITDEENNVIRKVTGIGTAVSNTGNNVAIALFPNPTRGTINIRSGYNEKGTVTVCNMVGAAVYNGTLNDGSASIDLSAQPDGLYLVRINTAGSTVVRKVELMH
ncbi:MAG: T9SS type A sorting domain-containing protein [Taibaiella sp.]|nr:T9SS type A sorting domain-containing protein [Taibaiella sp.]